MITYKYTIVVKGLFILISMADINDYEMKGWDLGIDIFSF